MIKDCPFCGGTDIQERQMYRSNVFYIICANCACRGPEGTDSTNAIYLWNERQSNYHKEG